MSTVLFLGPQPIFQDPNQQSIHLNSTVIANGSMVLSGYGASEISLFINVKAAPTGISPTLQYFIQEVDPGDGSTVIGSSVSSTVINSISIERITLLSTYGGSVKISWIITGAGASFTQVYSTLVAKAGTSIQVDSSGNEKGTFSNPQRIDPTGTTVQPVTGPLTQIQLETELDEKFGDLGQKTSAGSAPVVVASDQPPISVSGTVTAQQGTSPWADNVAQWGGAATSLGQKVMASSVPVAIASDQSAVPTTNANIDVLLSSRNAEATQLLVKADLDEIALDTDNLALIKAKTDNLDVLLSTRAAATTQTDGTQKAIARGGAKGATVAADLTSTAEGADHQALDIQIYHGGAAKDPTQIRALTAADIVTAQQGTSPWVENLTQVGGSAIALGQAAMAASLPVAIASNQSDVGVKQATASNLNAQVQGAGADNAALTGNPVRVGASDGTNLQTPRVFDADTGAGTQYVTGVSLRKAASGGSVEAGTSSDPLRVDPTGTTTQPVSAALLPLPTGAATSANQTTLGSQTTKVNDGTNTMAVSAAGAAKVDGSAVTQPISAVSLPLPTGASQEHATASSPNSTRLSDGAAFYDAAKTGQLPAALVGGRLDENVGAWLGSTAPTVGQKASASSLPVVLATEQTGADDSTNGTSKVPTLGARANAIAPAWTEGHQEPLSVDLFGNQRMKLSGVQSAGNSTTATLGGAGVFTGIWEDISDVAVIQFIAFADQASASSGFSIQWSPDGTNADVTENTNLSASSGRAFSLTPRGRFFRIVYTNGAVAQGAFRLRTVYHTNGVGLISRLLSATITEDNFAQNVRAFLAGKDASGNFQNLTSNPNKSLAISDIGTRTRVGSYGAATARITGSASAQNIASIENPAASGKVVYVKQVKVSASASAGTASVTFQYRLGRTTATPSAGTTDTAQKHDTNDATPVAIIRASPTATAATGSLWAGTGPIFQNATSLYVNEIEAWKSLRDDENIVLAAGEGLLLSVEANDVDYNFTASFRWEEV